MAVNLYKNIVKLLYRLTVITQVQLWTINIGTTRNNMKILKILLVQLQVLHCYW